VKNSFPPSSPDSCLRRLERFGNLLSCRRGASIPARKATTKIRVKIRMYGFMVRSNISPRFNSSLRTLSLPNSHGGCGFLSCHRPTFFAFASCSANS